MLKLSKKDGTPIGSFENYRELYRHIAHEENPKLFEDHPQFAQSEWSFMCLSPKMVRDLLTTLKKKYDTKMLREAWHRGLSVVEMCEGDYQDVRQVLVTGNVNVEALREDWCIDCCEAHDMRLTEFG